MDQNVLRNISYGMYIVSSNDGKKLNGQIANAVTQIASEPATIAVSINKKNLTHAYIASSGRFSLTILDESSPFAFIGKFGFRSGRNEDKFKDVNFRILASGCPVVIDHAVCYLEAKVINGFDCGTHTLFLGEMTEGEILKQGKVMTYDYYHQVKRGKTPATAPTFIKAEAPGTKPADTHE